MEIAETRSLVGHIESRTATSDVEEDEVSESGIAEFQDEDDDAAVSDREGGAVSSK